MAARPPAPGALQLQANGADTLRLQWGASPNGPWRHHLQLAHTPDFTSLLDERELEEPGYTRPLPPPGTYHVRVRQIDAFGLPGPWSATQSLEVPARVLTSDRQPLTNVEGVPVTPGAR